MTEEGYFLSIPILITVCTTAVGVFAHPATIFLPHLRDIQQNLPKGLVMRLPKEIPLSGHSDIEDDKLVISIFPSETPQSFTVGVFTCIRSQHPCLLGSFSVEKQTSESAKVELDRHQVTGDRLSLATNLQGYLIDGQQQHPPQPFSTMMWQQNQMIYSISFPATERKNIIWMATSMAQEKPVTRD